MQSTIEKKAQVVVAGAGPAGLMLACELKLMGVDVTLIERRAAGTTGESRAPGINARSMEAFAQRGLADEFKARGKPLPAVLFSGIPMDPAANDPGWPDALILPQHQTERILAAHAAQLGVTILWSTPLVHFNQTDDGVSVLVQRGDALETITADYLVGCDGGHSAVRKLCGAGFQGDDPVSDWVVADVQLDAPPGERGAFGRNTRIGTYQVSLVEPGWFRLSLMKRTPPPDRSAPVTLDELRQTMLEGLGTDHGLRSARWMSRFSDGFRQVELYRHGRVFLAGDAAHTHSPIGGQGLNLGIQDAVNLGWKLAQVLIHHAPDALLDSYHAERHPIASTVLQLARAQTALIKPGTQIDALRSVVSRMLSVPAVTQELAGILSGLDLRYPLGETHPLLGRRVPDLKLTVDGRETSVFAQMHTGHALLLDFGGLGDRTVPRANLTTVKATPEVDAANGRWKLPVAGEFDAPTALFVRPDGYVAWVGTAQNLASLDAALQTWLG